MTIRCFLLGGTAAWLLAGSAAAWAQAPASGAGEAGDQAVAPSRGANIQAPPTPQAPRTPQQTAPAKGRNTYAPTGSGEASSQEQLTQNSQAAPTRFLLRNKPVPVFPNPYPAAAGGDGPRAGPYMYIRYAEDWSSLRRPAAGRSDLFDALKFIPLNGSGATYLTLSGESRLRLNYVTNPGLREAEAQDQWLVRNVVGADLHVGPHFRAFGELNSSVAFGAPGVNASPQQDNDLVVQQLFAEVDATVSGAAIGLRVGRQEFMDGPPNVLHIRPAPNVYTSLDGVRVNVATSRARASLFSFKTVALGRGAFDDPSDDGERFRGISTSFVLPSFRMGGADTKLFLDPFYWNHRDDDRRWGTTVGRDDRDFYGARLWGTGGDATVDLSVIRQGGRFAGRDISAWGVFANGGYLLDDGPWHPRIGAHADYTSGGGAYGTGTLKSFLFFYGSIPYFSWGNLIGPTNLSDVSLNMRVTPLPRVSVTAEASRLRRSNEFDAVYTFTGAPYAGTQNVRGHDIGQLIKASVLWQLNPHLSAGVKTDFLFAGDVLKRAGLHNSTFLGTEVQFRF